ncbi:histone-lysine N-methyltransferase SETMAR [Trichonephila clavata]|uniref:Histone-lysine N-methyltransferase SETMAR n=1 Tax=Trichonephila clavata TaxID=2740835 RepID=A0A8X6HJ00_TRICU|nr:histone-lysine N-methyltransferase SETMAR [Trichonephila clavata]
MLSKVSNTIREKRKKNIKRQVVLFHQDNARPHVSAMTDWTLYTLEWDFIHQPYNPGTLLSDYYLLPHLQLNIDGTIFHSNDEVINEVDRFLDSRTP